MKEQNFALFLILYLVANAFLIQGIKREECADLKDCRSCTTNSSCHWCVVSYEFGFIGTCEGPRKLCPTSSNARNASQCDCVLERNMECKNCLQASPLCSWCHSLNMCAPTGGGLPSTRSQLHPTTMMIFYFDLFFPFFDKTRNKNFLLVFFFFVY